MNKKIIIIGIGGIVAITGAIVIPIIFIGNNNNNEEKNKEDVEAIIKILKSKSSSQKTLILEGNSTGKIISNNKEKIIAKIKKLIGFEKLRGVKFDVSLENDVDISTTEKFIIVTVKKEKHSQQLKGKNGLKVKRAKNVQEIKIDTIKEYLNNSVNLNLTLPKTNYSTDNEILIAIRKLLATQINNIEINDTNLITKKENSSEVVLVAAHNDEETTPYEITIDDEDFTLNLNQEEFSEDEKNVKNIKQSLESLTLKEITIDASSGSINNNKNSILEKLQTLSGYPLDLKGVSLSIKDSSDLITLEGIAFIIELSKGSVVNQELRGFIVKRSQSQAETDQNDVDEIKQLLNALTSKEVTIDASSGSITTNKNSILGKLQTLSDYPSDLKGVIVSIKEEETEINLEGIEFIIKLSKGSVVNQELRGFTVKRSQTPIEIDQNDINEVERLLNALNLKEITIDASSGSITTNKNSILEKLQTLSGYPSDLKGVIVSIKEEETEINLEGVAFTIELSKGDINQELRGFTVKRSQSQVETDQNDVDEIKVLLNVLNLKEVTIDESSGSITTNKNSILGKLQALSDYPLDLKGVIVSIKEEETEINLEGIEFIIKLSKGSVVNQELRGFTVKRSQTPTEKIKNNIKEYLKISINLNIFLPKDTGSDYDEDSKILAAIRKKLEILKPLDFSKNDFDNLITKKQSPSSTPITEIATHSIEETTPYEIIVDGEDFILQLKQNQYTSEEEKNTIINSIKTYLGDENNLNIILPKIKDFNYDEDSKILTAIKTKLIDSIPNFKNYDANLIVKEGSVPITEVANHDATNPTEYKIIVDEEHFTLKLKKDQFTEEEKTKINAIEKHFETSSNLNLKLPQAVYDTDNAILEAIKVKLVNDIETISSSDSHLIVKKIGSSAVTSVATHGQSPTQYEITVGEHEFTLNLNQDQFSESEKTKINVIKTYLENLDNFNLILPKTTYSNNDDILNAIKLKLENDIEDISNSDSYLIVKKDSNMVNEVAAHNAELPTSYEITIGEHEFTLKLKQEKFTELEKTKINTIKTYLENLDNFNLILPRILYDDSDDILNVIKLKLENNINDISNSDFYLIVKKDSNTVNEVATHDAELPTSYEIAVGEHEFTLKLKQEKFTELEKTKINIIKTYLENLDNFNLILPKTTYSDDNSILEAIKSKLENDIEDISSGDSYLIIKKGSTLVTEVAIHNAPIPTSYGITVGEHEFILKLKQEKFTELEKTKINNIKNWLNTLDNLNIILPKDTGSDYNQDSKVLMAIKKVFVDGITSINDDDFNNLITKKQSSPQITSIAAYDSSTPYVIVVGEEEFTLNLKQDQFTELEKTKINAIKTYLDNLDNFNLTLPKGNYSDGSDNLDSIIDSIILDAIKLKLENNINEFTIGDYNLITKKVDSTIVTEVATHDTELPTKYIIVVGKDEFTLKLKQEEFTELEKRKIENIQDYLKNINNVNFWIPKKTYTSTSMLLEAIKLEIIKKIDSDEITSSDSYLIKLHDDEETTLSIAAYGESPTQYKIIVGEEDLNLNLWKAQFTEEEKINAIKNYLDNLDNFNLILPKTTYSDDNSILEAIKLNLINNVDEIKNSDSNLITKKQPSNPISSIVAHDSSTPTPYIITIGGIDYNLQLKQAQFTEEEKNNAIKEYLRQLGEYDKFILPKITYSSDDSILKAIRLKLVNTISKITTNDFYLINKKINSDIMNDRNVLPYGADPIGKKYIITIDGEHFELNPFKDQFIEEEKTKINAIKIYLETGNNLNLILPKTTYSNNDDIFNAIRVKLVNDIEDISSGDSHLIFRKVVSNAVTSIATHSQSPTPYIIIVGDEHEFTLHLNQDEFTIEQKKEQKINAIKTYLENMDTNNFILPKDNYDNDNDILNAIKEEFALKVNKFTTRDYYLITKKESSPEVVEVKSNEGTEVTPYEISVGGENFILRLKQSQFTKEEILKINIIKKHFKHPPSIFFSLPKRDYINDDDILNTIRKILVNKIEGISDDDSYLIIKKPGEEDFDISVSIPTSHRDAPSYKIIVGEYSVGEDGFELIIKQDLYNKQEQIQKIKEHIDILNTENNLNFIISKDYNISNDDDILEEIIDIIGRDLDNAYNDLDIINLVIKKVGEEDITSIATFDEDYTIYKITIGEYEYSFKLKKEKYNKEERINEIKKYLEISNNLNITIPKKRYERTEDVLDAVKSKLFKNINNEVPNIRAQGLQYLFYRSTHIYDPRNGIFVEGTQNFKFGVEFQNKKWTFNLNQDQFTESEKTKINAIKTYLKTGDNLNLILPKTTYDNDDSILEAIKLKLVNDIETISSGDSYLIVKKVGSREVTSVAIHGQPPTQYIIVVGENELTLNLNQESGS